MTSPTGIAWNHTRGFGFSAGLGLVVTNCVNAFS